MSGGPRISFNAIDSALSSLKNCQSYINSGMDVATQVALDLVESYNRFTWNEQIVKVITFVRFGFHSPDYSA